MLSNDYTGCLTYLMKYPGNIDITMIIRHAMHMKSPQVCITFKFYHLKCNWNTNLIFGRNTNVLRVHLCMCPTPNHKMPIVSRQHFLWTEPQLYLAMCPHQSRHAYQCHRPAESIRIATTKPKVLLHRLYNRLRRTTKKFASMWTLFKRQLYWPPYKWLPNRMQVMAIMIKAF